MDPNDLLGELFDDPAVRATIKRVIVDTEDDPRLAKESARLRKGFEELERLRPLQDRPSGPVEYGGWPDHTAFERVHSALGALATRPTSLQARLDVAAMTLAPLLKEDFRPGEERSLFLSIMDAVTKAAEPVGDEGTISASTRALDDEAAAAVARDILRLHGLLYA
jgi:hypothetical protein